ncbi:M1 family metallopeptidase [Kribbella sp. CA-253562]|uniref:M1 family metallopeptidase n=1 Tax=Kribbella sp. CA-253562 TaxID=3239942 RepID=UPI003D9178B0
MSSSHRFTVLLTATIGLGLSATLVATTAVASAPAAHGSPGVHSLGDRLFPTLGNGGYDVQDYDLSLRYRPDRTTMAASVTIRALSTQALSSFSLDSVAQRITGVRVDGRAVPFRLDPAQEKLIVTARIPDRRLFDVRIDYVADRSQNPAPPGTTLPPGVDWPIEAWVKTPDGFATFGQPNRAHQFFPSNDYPSDKARYTVRLTVPSDRTAVSAGRLLAKYRHHGETTWIYRTDHPIKPDVLPIAVGRFREIEQTGPHGLPVRSYVTLEKAPNGQTLTEPMELNARQTPAQLAWLEQQIGRPFPYESYGVVGLASAYNGVALETATLSTFGGQLAAPPEDEAPTLVHEMAHQYFGDAVAVRTWDDMWLSEGHARYYERKYAGERGFIDYTAELKTLYERDQSLRDEQGPAGRLKNPGSVLFDTDAPGQLMLVGLNHLVGDATFRTIERTFYDRYRDGVASTADYVAIANQLSGRDLTPYFDAWLYSPITPPMPGHPDWHSTKKA